MKYTRVCRRCNQELHNDSFRKLTRRFTGVCKCCEAKALWERELRANARRMQDGYENFRVCKHCGEKLHVSSFRTLREQLSGVCKACEAKAVYESEIYANERRLEQHFEHVRTCRLHVLPDDL